MPEISASQLQTLQKYLKIELQYQSKLLGTLGAFKGRPALNIEPGSLHVIFTFFSERGVCNSTPI